MMSLNRLKIALCLVAASLPAVAVAGQSRTTLTIQGTVATICHVDFDRPIAGAASGGTVDLGHFEELCNDRDGYRIVIQHPAGLQNASVEYGGVSIPLSAGTETVIVDSNVPAYRTGE